MSKVSELEDRYNRLFKDGKLVQVHVSKWSMACKLTEEDLDLAPGEFLPAFMKLGNKMLIDNAVLTKFVSLEGRARSYLKDNSHDFPIAQAHFVPTKRLVKVIEVLNNFKTTYAELTEEFLTNYDTHKEEMLASNPNYRTRLEPFYPSVDWIRNKFGFELSIFEIAIPKRLKETDLLEIKAEAAAVAAMKTKYEAEMERQYQRGVSMIDTFVEGTVQKVRTQIVNVFEVIAEKIKNREVITKTNINSMQGIIDNFEALDFLDDAAINAKIIEVKTLLNSNTDFKEDQQSIQRLGTAINSVLTTAKDVSDVSNVTGRYFRKIDLD